jgi:outer membrane lipoprotein SlyB
MKSFFKSLLVIALAGLVLTGCNPSLSSNDYSYGSAGQVSRVLKGTIVSARIVTVDNNGQNTAGTVAGGVAGAIAAGSTIGGGNGSALAAVGGAVLGGVIGNRIENSMSKQQGMEYVVKTKGDGLVSIVQGLTPTFQRGQKVMIIYGGGGEGSRGRVVADDGSY